MRLFDREGNPERWPGLRASIIHIKNVEPCVDTQALKDFLEAKSLEAECAYLTGELVSWQGMRLANYDSLFDSCEHQFFDPAQPGSESRIAKFFRTAAHGNMDPRSKEVVRVLTDHQMTYVGFNPTSFDCFYTCEQKEGDMMPAKAFVSADELVACFGICAAVGVRAADFHPQERRDGLGSPVMRTTLAASVLQCVDTLPNELRVV